LQCITIVNKLLEHGMKASICFVCKNFYPPVAAAVAAAGPEGQPG
jgi:hypothetical protein